YLVGGTPSVTAPNERERGVRACGAGRRRDIRLRLFFEALIASPVGLGDGSLLLVKTLWARHSLQVLSRCTWGGFLRGRGSRGTAAHPDRGRAGRSQDRHARASGAGHRS